MLTYMITPVCLCIRYSLSHPVVGGSFLILLAVEQHAKWMWSGSEALGFSTWQRLAGQNFVALLEAKGLPGHHEICKYHHSTGNARIEVLQNLIV